MSIMVLFIIMGTTGIVTFALCATSYMGYRLSGKEKKVLLVSASVATTAFVLAILFAIHSKPEITFNRSYSLEEFNGFENVYVYSYLNDDGEPIEGSIKKELANLDFYDEKQFVEVNTTSYLRRFWFMYDGNEGTEADYIFHVIPSRKATP